MDGERAYNVTAGPSTSAKSCWRRSASRGRRSARRGPQGADSTRSTTTTNRRNAQVWSYNNTYGEAPRRFAIKTWTTTDDNRIERLMSETYGRGYFSVDELRPYARSPLAVLPRARHRQALRRIGAAVASVARHTVSRSALADRNALRRLHHLGTLRHNDAQHALV